MKPAKILVHETGGRLSDLGIAEDNFVSAGAIPTGSIGYMIVFCTTFTAYRDKGKFGQPSNEQSNYASSEG